MNRQTAKIRQRPIDEKKQFQFVDTPDFVYEKDAVRFIIISNKYNTLP